MGGMENRRARFRTVIALILENREYLFDGKVEGTIISEPRGSEGFGYDPVFLPEGQSETFAEMNADRKNGISHRGQAVEALMRFLREKGNKTGDSGL